MKKEIEFEFARNLKPGEYVKQLFGDGWHICKVVNVLNRMSGTDLLIEAVDDPSLRRQSYFPYREERKFEKVTL